MHDTDGFSCNGREIIQISREQHAAKVSNGVERGLENHFPAKNQYLH